MPLLAIATREVLRVQQHALDPYVAGILFVRTHHQNENAKHVCGFQPGKQNQHSMCLSIPQEGMGGQVRTRDPQLDNLK